MLIRDTFLESGCNIRTDIFYEQWLDYVSYFIAIAHDKEPLGASKTYERFKREEEGFQSSSLCKMDVVSLVQYK